MMVQIYGSADDFRTHSNTRQPRRCTGSERVKNRNGKSVVVCLVVICVLLTVIVMCVRINRNNHHVKYKMILEERNQLLTKYTNITEETDGLLSKYTNLSKVKNGLLSKYTNLTEEKKLLLTKYTNLTEEKKLLLTKYTNLTEEKKLLLTKYTNLTEEKKQLLSKYTNLTENRKQHLNKYKNITENINKLRSKYKNITKLNKQLNQEKNELWTHLHDGWIYNEFSLYFISSELKNWSESRRYCRERGADLIIINNIKEQDFILNVTGGKEVWIGLSDRDEEGRWKWVDNSTMTSDSWGLREPNGGTKENCVESYRSGWNDNSCYNNKKWICERNMF